VPVHGRDEQSVHRLLGALKEVRGLGSVEPAPPGRDGELVMERCAKPEKALDGLAEREPKPGRGPAILGRRF